MASRQCPMDDQRLRIAAGTLRNYPHTLDFLEDLRPLYIADALEELANLRLSTDIVEMRNLRRKSEGMQKLVLEFLEGEPCDCLDRGTHACIPCRARKFLQIQHPEYARKPRKSDAP